MSKYWKPLIPMRFVQKQDGSKMLQQAWGLYTQTPYAPYEAQIDHEWRDVPLMPEEKGDGKQWCQEVPPTNT